MRSSDKLPIVRQPFHKPPSESRRVTRDTSQCLVSRGTLWDHTQLSWPGRICVWSVHGHAEARRVSQYQYSSSLRWEIRNLGLRLNKPTGWNTIPSVIGYLVKIRVLNLTPFIEITYQKGPRKNCSIEFCYWEVFSSFVPKLNRPCLELTWSNRFKPVICCSILVLMYRMLNIPFF